jgi:formamidopyrimidine-DNA glycosylase
MPELPEVEITKLGLEPQLNQMVIGGFLSDKTFRYPLPMLELQQLLEEESFQLINLKRRAKYLTCTFKNVNNDSVIPLTFHLGMSGSLTICQTQETRKKHEHLILSFDNGYDIRFHDPRRFGFIRLHDEIEWHQLGSEPFTCTPQEFYEKIRHLKTNIKSILLSGKAVVGAGNINACERLFHAQINPHTLGCYITEQQAHKLLETVKNVLAEAIELGGSTLQDFQAGENQKGYFQTKMVVYNQEEKPCLYFHDINHPYLIQRFVQNGRSTYWCPGCQTNNC